jgi:serine/threonine-protein kinase
MLGSPLYMAPEQMRSSRDVDARGDVWALGVVLFELLTGRSPFEADTMPELCLKIVSEPPLSLAKLRPAVPPAMVEVVERCLEKDKNKRYANASELAVALAPFVPPRNSVFSIRPTDALGGSPPVSLFTPPIPVSAGPGRNPSIPAAWGTEGRRESQQAPPRRRPLMAWVLVSSLVAGAAMVAVLVSRPGRSTEPSQPAASASIPPPPVTELASATPEPIPAPADVPPPAAESVAAGPGPVAEPSSQAGPPRGVPSMQVVPRTTRTGGAPSVAGGASAKPDDDIPALR